MAWQRTALVGDPPPDPLGDAVARALSDILPGAVVELRYAGRPAAGGDSGAGGAGEAPGPPGWDVTVAARLDERLSRLVPAEGRNTLSELVDALPAAAARAITQFRPSGADLPVNPPLERVLRDTVAAEILAGYLGQRLGRAPHAALVAEIIEYLIELSGTRVESHDLTHGVLVAGVLADDPRLEFQYPADIRAAKRAPLLFDGQRSVLVVDPDGRARTELQRHRLGRLAPDEPPPGRDDDTFESGLLVARATAVYGGMGFYVRADRSIWTFVDGQPLLVRRGEHWTAFPLELTASLENMIGGGEVAALVARAAFIVSSQPGGAILAIVEDADRLGDIVPLKDRYDLRGEIDPEAMRPETRLHHLIDARDLDARTLARLATLDGATVLDREGNLVAYGAIVTTMDSQHEGARTAAARTLSETAAVVLRVSVDGEITIFRRGVAVTTLLGRGPEPLP